MSVSHKGTVRWFAPIEIQTFCELTVHNWPYDSHECEMTIIPASFMDSRVRLIVDELIGPNVSFFKEI